VVVLSNQRSVPGDERQPQFVGRLAALALGP
jgi:hypothetical protein